MTILMLKKPRHKQEQPKEKTNTQAANTHTHKHRLKGKERTQPITFPTVPEKHDSKKRVTSE